MSIKNTFFVLMVVFMLFFSASCKEDKEIQSIPITKQKVKRIKTAIEIERENQVCKFVWNYRVTLQKYFHNEAKVSDIISIIDFKLLVDKHKYSDWFEHLRNNRSYCSIIISVCRIGKFERNDYQIIKSENNKLWIKQKKHENSDAIVVEILLDGVCKILFESEIENIDLMGFGFNNFSLSNVFTSCMNHIGKWKLQCLLRSFSKSDRDKIFHDISQTNMNKLLKLLSMKSYEELLSSLK